MLCGREKPTEKNEVIMQKALGVQTDKLNCKSTAKNV